MNPRISRPPEAEQTESRVRLLSEHFDAAPTKQHEVRRGSSPSVLQKDTTTPPLTVQQRKQLFEGSRLKPISEPPSSPTVQHAKETFVSNVDKFTKGGPSNKSLRAPLASPNDKPSSSFKTLPETPCSPTDKPVCPPKPKFILPGGTISDSSTSCPTSPMPSPNSLLAHPQQLLSPEKEYGSLAPLPSNHRRAASEDVTSSRKFEETNSDLVTLPDFMIENDLYASTTPVQKSLSCDAIRERSLTMPKSVKGPPTPPKPPSKPPRTFQHDVYAQHRVAGDDTTTKARTHLKPLYEEVTLDEPSEVLVTVPSTPVSKQPVKAPARGLHSPIKRRGKNQDMHKTNLDNPFYGAIRNDIIPIQTKLTRSSSDEVLYADPKSLSREGHTGVPHFVTSQGVAIDVYGYAVPSIANSTALATRPRSKSLISTIGRVSFDESPEEVREKVSMAYASALRRNSPTSDQLGKTEGDADSLVDETEHKHLLSRVTTVQNTVRETARQQNEYRAANKKRLFEYAMVVHLLKANKGHKTHVHFVHPTQPEEEVENLATFLFPDLEILKPVTEFESESFVFVMTNVNGLRKYGFCRRFLPPAANNRDEPRMPEAFCIISPLPAQKFYEDMLRSMEDKRRISLETVELMIKSGHHATMPEPGKEAMLVVLNIKKKKVPTATLR